MVAIYTLLLPKKEDGQSEQVMQERKEETKEETKIRKEGIPCRVYEIKNEVENSEFKFKAIVFHCATREEMNSFQSYNTNFKVVGSKLIATKRSAKLEFFAYEL